MEPKIIFQDEQIIIVDKPSGMIVHPDGKHDYPALDKWLQEKFGEIHLVHRIDRETSGILLVARNEQAYEFLKKQFQAREVKKVYRAFVYGVLGDDRGTIDKPIGSARGGLGPRSATRPHGTMRDATTLYSVRARGKDSTYIDAFPKTGRTHQIRVHFSAIQHPIIRDQLYAPQREPMLGFKRLALHALSISFVHPSGKPMSFEAPLPDDFIAAQENIVAS